MRMRDRVRSYLVFTSLLYRIIMFILVPAALIGIGIAVGNIFGTGQEMLLVVGVVVGVSLTMVEIISDTWLFGGIQKKREVNLEYLKTSDRGKKVLQNALIVELVRKFLMAVCITGISIAILICLKRTELGGVVISLLYLVLISYFFSVLGTFIARFWDMLWINVLTCYLTGIVQALCLLVPVWSSIAAVAVLAVLCVSISVAAVKMPLRRMEGSYYDQ